MSRFASTALRSAGLYALALALAIALAVWRVGALASNAPLALWLPFVRPLLSAAFELSLLLGVPAAAVYSWARLGVAAARRELRWMAPGLTLAGVSIAGAVLTDIGTQAPGKLVQELIDAGEASCANSVAQRVDVPLVSLQWSCSTGAAPTVSGKAPSFGAATFQAKALRVSADLRSLDLSDAHVEVPPTKSRLGARVSARRARLKGLPSWGRPRHVSLELRLAFFSLAVLTVIAVSVRATRALRLRRELAVWGAGCAGALLLFAQQSLDRLGSGAAAYLWLMPLGAIGALAGLALVRVAGRGRAVAGAGDRW